LTLSVNPDKISPHFVRRNDRGEGDMPSATRITRVNIVWALYANLERILLSSHPANIGDSEHHTGVSSLPSSTPANVRHSEHRAGVSSLLVSSPANTGTPVVSSEARNLYPFHSHFHAGNPWTHPHVRRQRGTGKRAVGAELPVTLRAAHEVAKKPPRARRGGGQSTQRRKGGGKDQTT